MLAGAPGLEPGNGGTKSRAPLKRLQPWRSASSAVRLAGIWAIRPQLKQAMISLRRRRGRSIGLVQPGSVASVLFSPVQHGLGVGGNPVMKVWSVIGLLFTAAIIATIPISPQVTPRGVELSVGQAQAITATSSSKPCWSWLAILGARVSGKRNDNDHGAEKAIRGTRQELLSRGCLGGRSTSS
jgi:hypothetical protein